MIRSVQSAEAAALFEDLPVRRSRSIERTARRKLLYLHAAKRLEDLRVPPGNQLERWTGDRAGTCSIRIDGQWRICFEWRDGDAYNVEIVDYH